MRPQQYNSNANEEQTDNNVNINDSFADISSLQSVTASNNTLSTNTNEQILATTNDNNQCLSQVNTPAMCQLSAANEGDLEDGYDYDRELGPYYHTADRMVEF